MKPSKIIRPAFIWTLLVAASMLWTACDPKENDPTPPLQTQKDIDVIDSKIIDFMTAQKIPGASLAISKNGKLVYKKAYGKADVEGNIDMTTKHRMRVASVSKTFTGVAIMRLVQAGQLSLDDRVFGQGGILGSEFGTKAYNDRILNVTVRHLLQMTTGGWVLANDRDAIDFNPTMNNIAFFNWMMDNALLKHDPGTRYWYVNTNYFVAARIIEKVTGKSFYQFMKDDFLTPLGINSAVFGKSAMANLHPDETKYYGQGGTKGFEYNLNIERRDGDGGLVINASDLLKFVLAIDGNPSRPDILNATTYQQFIQGSGPSPLNPNFGNGIVKWNTRYYFYGALPGTRSSFMTESNGMAVVLIFNGNADYTNGPVYNIFAQAHQALLVDLLNNNLNAYQDIDQF
ncbi:serine hydrolase domain-containing protein [Algoriphagus sp.]|uniref:serine hydrolase domain-containing protein n=1 Tax=Algoriphagus sp. TaxID=1872435 RepID=UPI00391B0A55